MEGEIKLNIRAERLAKSQEMRDEGEDYRDTIATVDEKGKRIWIYPKKPSGRLHNWRIAVTVFLLALLFGGPFITVNGQPLLLLNVFERRFVFFGQAFWPQDFVVLAILLITFFVFIILFTVVFGRVWCGWMCPQTLFMEMVFRKIEYAIEGDAAAQRRLSKEPWTVSKIAKKTLKHVIFLLISVLIGHTVMAYLIGVDETFTIATQSPAENLAGFFGLTSFTLIIYGVYAKFREQACIAVCPYGRLQSVLLTKESIVVAYDWIRGEPRRPIRKNVAEMVPAGDCIDCKLCVHVCPTGIDIRNGTQLECVNCTACIDACDDVMIKIGRPKGLIRFASFKSIEEGVQKIFTGKVIGYTVVLLLLVGVLGFVLVSRSEVETTVLKVPGTLYQRDKDDITNLYNIEFVNKTFREMNLTVRVESPTQATLVKVDGKPVSVPAGDMIKQVWFIKISSDHITDAKTTVKLGVYEGEKLLETVKVKFISPVRKQGNK